MQWCLADKQMLCCLFIHRSQIHTSAARILSTRNCFSQSVHSTETTLQIGLQALADDLIASASLCTTTGYV